MTDVALRTLATLNVDMSAPFVDALSRRPTLAFIFAGTLSANLAPIKCEEMLRRGLYPAGAHDQDGDRRAVSARAMAASLKMPFETVRNTYMELQTRDLCVHTRTGYYVPGEAFRTTLIREAYLRSLDALHNARDALARVSEPVLRTARAADCELLAGYDAEALRAIWFRIWIDFQMRYSECMTSALGNSTRTLVATGVIAAAVNEPDGPTTGADMLSSRELADRLRIPRETVRRHLGSLQEAGVVNYDKVIGWHWRRGDDGTLLGEVMNHRAISGLRRLVGDLARFGYPIHA